MNTGAVEVVYALLEQQEIIKIQIKEPITIEEAILQSGLLHKHPEIDLSLNSSSHKVGIYNQIKKLSDIVNVGDRVEIYRKLIANPKESRRKRAKKQQQEGVFNQSQE
ncbi:UPF0125 protein yfjF [hydrothermal vent metagenome]|uniref:UPF0125 protein yfjF n=1 Tax=hydrothermal vent metagenome TaxID=652676 RepID=A0A3B0V788_9ZZZZ